MDLFKNIFKTLSRMSKLLRTSTEYQDWTERCNENLSIASEYLRKRGLPIGTRQRITALIARIKTLRAVVRAKFSRAGHGLAGQSSGPSVVWEDVESAFEKRVVTGAVINLKHLDPRRFFKDARRIVLSRVTAAITEHSSVAVNTVLNAEFALKDKTDVKSFATRNHVLFITSNLREWFANRVMQPLMVAMEEFQERDSGWTLVNVENLMININRHNPIHAGCDVPLPRVVQSKRAVINVKCNDDACFLWSIVASLYPASTNGDRIASYPHYSKVLRTDCVKLPMTLDQLKKFEGVNEISVNVYQWQEEKCVPIHLTPLKREKHANLLLVQDPRNAQRHHFTCIRNLSRLVSAQIGRHGHEVFICDRCLHYFHSEEKLNTHSVDCMRLNECAVELPSEENKWLQFKNYNRKERVPFVVYADFECLLKDLQPEHRNTQSFAYQQHKAYSVGYYVKCAYTESLCMYRSYRGDSDCVEWFVKEMYELADRVDKIFKRIVPMETLSIVQINSFMQTTICHICGKPFLETDIKVRDHCHITGKYRGAAHSSCNLNYQDAFTIPVVFHNLSGYDAHFVIRELATAFEGKVDLLPITKEKYISFTKHVKGTGIQGKKEVKFRFIDSFKFLAASLDKLSSDLGKEQLTILRKEIEKEFPNLSESQFDLLTRKGVFPYDYVSAYDKLDETRLPPREAFYNRLNDKHVSESDYAHAINVWESFSIATLGKYSDLYLQTDVLLLADVFENFRTHCLESYELDPAYYCTLPGFAWDAMLKYTGIVFELLTDIDMVMFVERGIRGGLSQCSHRYASANNKYLPTYDPSKPSTYLMYFDVNNLYGWAMSQCMPYGGLRWIDDAERVTNFDVNSVPIDGPEGYFLEVDLEYPKELHDSHADLPFCPVREQPTDGKQTKLLATVQDKERYVIHYRYLQQCLRHGLRIRKIHRIIEFKQSHWLRDYIQLNTNFRTRATSDFQKNLYKLMNNAVFGKTMENVRNRVDVKLITRWDGRYGAEALIAKPNFHSRAIFSENVVAIQLRKLQVLFNKPIFVGMSILDVSKVCLYDFHYEYMLPKFSDRSKILYTDTDSLIYELACDDVYETMKCDVDSRFDTSDYPTDNPYSMPRVNKKVPGLMKDENNGVPMTEFVGLRAKMYSLRVHNQKDTRKIKGVKKSVVENEISFDDYVRCLREHSEKHIRQNLIRSKLHNVYSISEAKLALSPYDDKRFILPDGVHTLPWGHHRIPEFTESVEDNDDENST